MGRPAEPSHETEHAVALWLAAAQEGCDEAQGRLIEHCRGYLMAIAHSELDPSLRPKVAVSDVVQETLIRAQQRLDRFEGSNENELFAWLRRILLNYVTDIRRTYHGSHKRNVNRESDLGAAIAAFDSATPGRAIAAEEEVVRLRQALASLPDDYRRVITLRNWESLSFSEVGERMGRSPDAARMLWTRAVQYLGEQIGNETHDPQTTPTSGKAR